ncbi:hypothetical protein RFN28_32570, partial [Mesorhizobium sp. VK24D]|nr:hypothetical protein [Mesorhizobium sp. VK24D]
MSRSFSRQELHQLVWSRPVRAVASEYGISDVAFAKLCRKHNIPLPPRGYWARVEAGYKPRVEPLPVRGFGMPEIIRTGRTYWDRYSAPPNLDEIDIPPPPEFAESEEELTQRVRKLVGAVSIPRNLDRAHHQIARLLQEDESRRQEQLRAKYVSLSNGPLFDFPFERRRLRLLSGLFMAFQRYGMNVIARKKDPDDFEVIVGELAVSLSADHPGISRYGWRHESDANRPASAAMTVEIKSHSTQPTHKKWTDQPNDPVEGQATDIVVSVIVFGELQYRNREIGHHKWLVQRKRYFPCRLTALATTDRFQTDASGQAAAALAKLKGSR